MVIYTYQKKGIQSKEEKGMKNYIVYESLGDEIKTIPATCVSDACELFIGTLDKGAWYKTRTIKHIECALIFYNDNSSICSDFIVMEE